MNLEMVGKRTHDMAKVFHHQACFFNGDVLCACTITLIYHTINEQKCLKSRRVFELFYITCRSSASKGDGFSRRYERTSTISN